MNIGSSTAAAAALGYRPPPFTAAQWQELEHQALIFKYLMAGVPVPPDLLLPIRWSFDSVPASARFYPNATLGYYSYFGKKFDPEPGRCRRTDGKKWRCSKDAYGDSKYCERHMHRGRNRSRKHVESHTLAQSQSSSTMATLTPTGTSGGISAGFRAIPLQHSVVGGSNSQGASQLNLDTGLYGMGSKECRYPYKVKSEVDEHSFSEASGHVEDLKVDSALDSSWSLTPSRVSSFPLSKARSSSLLPSACPQLHSVQDVGQVTISSLPKQQQHHSFLGINYGASSEGLKHESQSLRPFFDEWPKTRDSWLDLEDEKSNRTSFSTTRLSISIPMAASDFNAASRSPNDD